MPLIPEASPAPAVRLRSLRFCICRNAGYKGEGARGWRRAVILTPATRQRQSCLSILIHHSDRSNLLILNPWGCGGQFSAISDLRTPVPVMAGASTSVGENHRDHGQQSWLSATLARAHPASYRRVLVGWMFPESRPVRASGAAAEHRIRCVTACPGPPTMGPRSRSAAIGAPRV